MDYPWLALNTPRPSTDPWLARPSQAIHGYQAIRGWPGPAVGPEQFGELDEKVTVGSGITVSIPHTLQRVAGSSRFNLGGPRRFLDVGGIIFDDESSICCCENCADTTYLSQLVGKASPSLWGISQLGRLSLLCMDRDHWIDASLVGLRVTKYGASTQLTVGTWIGVAEVGVDWVLGRIFGVVQWLNKEMPFSRGGGQWCRGQVAAGE